MDLKERMKTMEVEVQNSELVISEEELNRYQAHAKKEHPNAELVKIIILDEENVELVYKAPPIERIRRITGYLVGTLDRWNDAKRAEERDRVKHNSVYDEEKIQNENS